VGKRVAGRRAGDADVIKSSCLEAGATGFNALDSVAR
jgi:hypothetical protein